MTTPSSGPEELRPAEVAEEAATARDATSWAKSVSRLDVTNVPEGALNLNVQGRRLTSPIQGFGQMWQKTYQVRLPSATVSAPDLIATWKERFPEFWPASNRFHAPLTGIAPGEIALVDVTMPGHLKLSTGVMVLYADEESFTLMTPQGHMLAGWITFSAAAEESATVAQAQVLIRASDPLYEVGLMLGGHRQEDMFWQHTLRSLAAHHGEQAEVETRVVCVDKKRQWSKARNVWHNAGIRSGVYMAGAPARAIRKVLRRSRARKAASR